VKLSPQNAGGKPPIRELASNALAFLRGLAPVYRQYLNERAAHPGMLPVLMLNGHPVAEKAVGRQSATTFRPVFKIVSWTARGDLKTPPRQTAAPATNGAGAAAAPAERPDTGATRAAPPKQPDANIADDFG